MFLGMNHVQVELTRAKALISDPEKWTKHGFAKDEEGHPVSPIAYNAKCFCTVGALYCVLGSDYGGQSLALQALEAASKDLHNLHSVPRFNDSPVTKHADVLALFDRAIELAAKPSKLRVR